MGRHSLYVSPGAVKQTTKFTMTRDAENSLRVKLTAGLQSENDVGAAGFDAPVYLVLSYARAENLPRDKSSITVVYFRPDGLVEELVEVAAPADGHGTGRDAVLQERARGDHHGDQLAE